MPRAAAAGALRRKARQPAVSCAVLPLTRHLLVRHRLVATLAELRIIEHKPHLSFKRNGWPKMYRSASLEPGQIDYLYSELVFVPW